MPTFQLNTHTNLLKACTLIPTVNRRLHQHNYGIYINFRDTIIVNMSELPTIDISTLGNGLGIALFMSQYCSVRVNLHHSAWQSFL